ncbi:MAG TPA: TIGR03435 family protein [Bryobacteraceae bacterium]|jgi:uncharacterized protein (TIGR03435 family)
MRSVLFLLSATFCLTRAAFSLPAFEVAAIKPVDTRNGVVDAGVRLYPGGRLVIHALPLKSLIAAAYGVGYWQLSGGEDWMQKDAYDVEAKPAAQSGTYSLRHTRFGIGDNRVRQMLQTLLAERFQLKIHRETKSGSVYILERSGKKFLLRPTRYTEDQPVMGAPGFSGEIEHVGGHWYLFNTSVSQLAKFAGDYVLHKPVIDQTGLEGSFDYRDADAKSEQENGDFEGSFTVFIRDIGLKLRSSQGAVETLVIEHAEKPSAN